MNAETPHWCGRCAAHPLGGQIRHKSALTDVHLIQSGWTDGRHAMVYGSKEGFLHLHDLTIMPRGEETLKRTLARTVGGRIRRAAWRVNGSPSWDRGETSVRARQVVAARLYDLAQRLDRLPSAQVVLNQSFRPERGDA